MNHPFKIGETYENMRVATPCFRYRRPQFFVYPPHLPMFNQAEGVKLPKFVVQLSSAAVLYGFYIEKSDEAMDSGWR